MTIPNRNINYPTALKYGAGRISELADHCTAAASRGRCLSPIRASRSMPMVQAILADLKKAGLGVAIFSKVRPNPVEENVAEGVAGLPRRQS